MRKTVMIIGMSSFVGNNLAQILKNDFRVVGTHFQNPVEIPGVLSLPCDVLRKDFVNKMVAFVKPDFVIYAVGLNSLTECSVRAKMADALNSTGAINCMLAAERNSAKFVYVSSAFVMEGQNVLYRESDTPFPGTTYGNSKSSTEFYIQRSSLNYFIIRCPVLYGRSLGVNHENFFELMQSKFSKGEISALDGSVTTGFLDVSIMAEILKACLISNVTNRLLQISSQDYMTRYEFGLKYAEVFKKDQSLAHRADAKFPLDNSGKERDKKLVSLSFKLDPTNMEDLLGTKMPSIEESLKVSVKRLGGLS